MASPCLHPNSICGSYSFSPGYVGEYKCTVVVLCLLVWLWSFLTTLYIQERFTLIAIHERIVFWSGTQHSSFRNSSGMTKSGLWNSRCAPISLKLPWSCSRAPLKYPRTFLVIQPIGAKPIHVILNLSDVESFLGGLWNSSMEVLVIMVRIKIFKCPNTSCLNYYLKNYASTVRTIEKIIVNRNRLQYYSLKKSIHRSTDGIRVV